MELFKQSANKKLEMVDDISEVITFTVLVSNVMVFISQYGNLSAG